MDNRYDPARHEHPAQVCVALLLIALLLPVTLARHALARGRALNVEPTTAIAE